MVCLYVPGLTVLTSTLLMQTVCWKFELDGSQDMTADVLVTLLARTQDGPRGASLPIIMVQAESLDVFSWTIAKEALKKEIKRLCLYEEFVFH